MGCLLFMYEDITPTIMASKLWIMWIMCSSLINHSAVTVAFMFANHFLFDSQN